MRKLTVTSCAFTLAGVALAQAPAEQPHDQSNPLYRVTIVSRTTKALNYGYLSLPTRIGFVGTPVMPMARGEATIEPKRGATLINAHFNHVPPPTQFGAQYLTYVVWAISPEGRADNLGELSLNASDKGKLSTSTPMQTFALIVTAEPYYSVTKPSDVVVMENVVGPGTVGKVEEVNATYELLPRKAYTFNRGAEKLADGKALSRSEYESTLALYQAQSAIQAAESQQAQRYAPERFARAQQLLAQARQYPMSQSREIVSTAREATQVAEDSRAIASKRAEGDRAASEKIPGPDPKMVAEAERARDEAERARSEAERAVQVPQQAPPVGPAPVPPPAPQTHPAAPPAEASHDRMSSMSSQAAENRRRLFVALAASFDVIDTPRGLVVTLADPLPVGTALATRLRPLATALLPYRDLHVEVGGHSAAIEVALTVRQAETVRDSLIAAGAPSYMVVARGYGNTRPRESNGTAAGRAINQRVEIVITGPSIGDIPTWDRTYKIGPR